MVRRLHEYGIDCFLDNWSFRGGEVLSESLQGAIDRSDAMLVFVSASFAKSVWCQRELEWIAACIHRTPPVRVVPVRLDTEAIPSAISDLVFLDLTEASDANVIRVAEGLWKALGKKGGPGIFGRTQVLADKVSERVEKVIEGLTLQSTHRELAEIASLLKRPTCSVRDAGPCVCGGSTLCGFIDLGLVDWYSNMFHVCIDCFRHTHEEVRAGADQETGGERLCPWCKPLWMW